MTTGDENRDTLTGLLTGRLTRNRDFDRFAQGEGQRLYRLFRRLKALLAEVCDPGSRAWLERTGQVGAVVVHIDSMKYRRTARLEGWEADFFLRDMGGAGHLSRD